MCACRMLIVAWIPVILLIAELPRECLADKVVLKSGKTYHGRIVEETDTSVTIETDDGKAPTTQPKSIVKQILKSEINEQELEALRPNSPEKYYEVGSRLAEDAEDPRIRACAQHLLRIAIDRDDTKFAIPGNMMLARLTDGDERIRCLLEVLRRDPSQDLVREQLQAAKNQARQEHQVFVNLNKDNQKTSFATVIKAESTFLAARLYPVWPQLQQDIEKLPVAKDAKACKSCKDNGLVHCSSKWCKQGIVSCKGCGGDGKVTRGSAYAGPSGGGYRFDTVTCDRCDGIRPQWKCEQCGGDGTKPCQACASGRTKDEKSKSVSMPADLEQKLGMVSGLLSCPPDTSWARELLVEDRTPFRGLAAKESISDTAVKGRYYRRDGQWTSQ